MQSARGKLMHKAKTKAALQVAANLQCSTLNRGDHLAAVERGQAVHLVWTAMKVRVVISARDWLSVKTSDIRD